MTRLLLLASATAAALGSAAHAQPQPDFDAAVIDHADLGQGVYMISWEGAGNIGISVGEDGILMIDDQFSPLADKIAAEIEEAGADAGAVRFIVNTHHHADHAGGNEAWSTRGATVVAHDNAFRRLSTETVGPDGAPAPAQPPAAWPVVSFSETVTFHLNGQTVRVLHVPAAHTDGDAIVYFEEANVLHMGDVFFTGMFPFYDLNAGGTLEGYIGAQEAAIAMINDDTQVIPGHGPLGTKADLQAAVDMLRNARDSVAALAAQGMSAEEIVEANPLAHLDESWGQGFLNTGFFTNIVAQEQTAGAE